MVREEEDEWVEKVSILPGAGEDGEEEVGPLPLFVPGSKGVGKNAYVPHSQSKEVESLTTYRAATAVPY